MPTAPESSSSGPAPALLHDETPSAPTEPAPPASAFFADLIGMSRRRAWQIVGGLSKPTKMPCSSWGIPASTCLIGARLAVVEDSVCHSCYALRGFFRMPKVQQAYQRRLDRFGGTQWIDAMVKLVYWQAIEHGEPYFRWFDSGDLQSVDMLRQIAEVARRTPEVQHWLPTREYALLREYLLVETPPPNLLIRVSAPLVDGPAPTQLGLPTSGVHTPEGSPPGITCAAAAVQPAHCGGCRACWQDTVAHVSYPLH